jgi:hypothetical protein
MGRMPMEAAILGDKPATRGGEKPSKQAKKQGAASNSSQQGGSNPRPQQQPTRSGSTAAVQWTGSSPNEQYSPRTKRELD